MLYYFAKINCVISFMIQMKRKETFLLFSFQFECYKIQVFISLK